MKKGPKNKVGPSEGRASGNDLGRLSPMEKTAILLSALGPKAAGIIFQQLSENQIRQILEQMETVVKVPIPLVKLVLKEFFEAISEEKEYIFPFEPTPELLKELVGIKRGEGIWGKDSLQFQHKSVILDSLEGVDNQTLVNFLKQEHPQTVALVMTHLPPKRKSEIFVKLPETLKADVVIRMGQMDEVSPTHLAQLNDILRTELSHKSSRHHIRRGGTMEVSKMLQLLDQEAQDKLLAQLQSKDDRLTDEIKGKLFVFDDLLELTDHDIQAALKYVESSLWPKALRTAPNEVREKIFQNMSKRAADMLREDMNALGPMRRSVVEKAQQDIVAALKELESRKKISLSKGSRKGDPLV